MMVMETMVQWILSELNFLLYFFTAIVSLVLLHLLYEKSTGRLDVSISKKAYWTYLFMVQILLFFLFLMSSSPFQ